MRTEVGDVGGVLGAKRQSGRGSSSGRYTVAGRCLNLEFVQHVPVRAQVQERLLVVGREAGLAGPKRYLGCAMGGEQRGLRVRRTGRYASNNAVGMVAPRVTHAGRHRDVGALIVLVPDRHADGARAGNVHRFAEHELAHLHSGIGPHRAGGADEQVDVSRAQEDGGSTRHPVLVDDPVRRVNHAEECVGGRVCVGVTGFANGEKGVVDRRSLGQRR